MSFVRSLTLAAVASAGLMLWLVAAPSPSPASGAAEPHGAVALTKGDNDCDGDSDAVDALVTLQYVAGFFYNQEEFCLELGFPINPLADTEPEGIFPVPWVFGDIDCDFDVDAVDALLVLRVSAGLSINIPPPGLCPQFGAPY